MEEINDNVNDVDSGGSSDFSECTEPKVTKKTWYLPKDKRNCPYSTLRDLRSISTLTVRFAFWYFLVSVGSVCFFWSFGTYLPLGSKSILKCDLFEKNSDNNDVDQPIQSTVQNEQIKLTEMPREILEHILIQLDYKNLLTASHVCKLFASIAETAFVQKNKNNDYQIEHWYRTTERVNWTMLHKYGAKMQNISIYGSNRKFSNAVEKICHNMKRLRLLNVRKIIMLKNLKEVCLSDVHCLSRDMFIEFMNNNQEIERLELYKVDVDLSWLADVQLNMLKHLAWSSFSKWNLSNGLTKIRLNSLETLKLDGGHYLSHSTAYVCTRFLRALDCNKIKKIHVNVRFATNEDYEFDESDESGESDGNDESDKTNETDDFIDEICRFKTLTSLHLPYTSISIDQMRKLALHLPDLVEFHTDIKRDAENMMHSMLSVLPKLAILKINLHEDQHLDRILNELKRSVNDVHTRFAKGNIEFELYCHKFSYSASITNDRLLKSQRDSLEVQWMNNLNEKRVQQVMSEWRYKTELRFVNNCADQTFFISTLGKVYNGSSRIKCLDFKSIGPISVDSSVSLHVLFPRLKILKIHLVNHTATDFLRNLDANFCEQIEELWLNTKRVSDGPDMTDTIAKFKQLKSIHLDPLAVKIDMSYIFSICQNMEEIKRIPCDNSE